MGGEGTWNSNTQQSKMVILIWYINFMKCYVQAYKNG